MMGNIFVHLLIRKDVDNYLETLRILWGALNQGALEVSNKDAKNYIDDESTFVYGIFIEDKLIGVASIILLSKPFGDRSLACRIEEVSILPEYQRSGYGKYLINWIIDHIKYISPECYKIELNCATHNINFYKKCNFYLNPNSMRIDLI